MYYTHQSPIVLQKVKETNKLKYGVEYSSQNDIIRNKQNLTNYNMLNLYYKNKYNLDIKSYNNNFYNILCNKCNSIYKISNNLLRNRLHKNYDTCTLCNPLYSSVSLKEIQLLNFIKENYNGEIISNTKIVINPYELDIYIPELNLAFEFNGLY